MQSALKCWRKVRHQLNRSDERSEACNINKWMKTIQERLKCSYKSHLRALRGFAFDGVQVAFCATLESPKRELNFDELWHATRHLTVGKPTRKLQLQQSACLSFAIAALPFVVSCARSFLVGVLCLESVEVNGNVDCGFSQNLLTL